MIETQNPVFYDFAKREIERLPRITLFQQLTAIAKTTLYQIATSNYLFNLITMRHYMQSAKKGEKIAHRMPTPMRLGKMTTSNMTRPSVQAIHEWCDKSNTYISYWQHRKKIVEIYRCRLSDLIIDDPVVGLYAGGLLNLPIFVASKRDELFISLILAGFDVGTRLYDNCAKNAELKEYHVPTPNLDQLMSGLICLPTHVRVDENYASDLCTHINAFLRGN